MSNTAQHTKGYLLLGVFGVAAGDVFVIAIAVVVVWRCWLQKVRNTANHTDSPAERQLAHNLKKGGSAERLHIARHQRTHTRRRRSRTSTRRMAGYVWQETETETETETSARSF